MPTGGNLRRGDVVEVKNAAEILATLDDRGTLDNVPFMPEMVALCGRRFVVDRRTEKTCDTMRAISRRLPDCVLLEELRCDGSAHDGCQNDCRIFWKEAWLRKVGAAEPRPSVADDQARATLAALTSRNTKHVSPEGSVRYVCQATEHVRASQPVSTWDPRPYFREYTSGNVTLLHFARVSARALAQHILWKIGARSAGPVKAATPAAPPAPLGLRAGDVVRAKSTTQIARTLDVNGSHNGMWFDNENVPYCGGTFRVHRRIERYINDVTGEMVEATDYVTLENVTCTGDHSLSRWFCPRNFYVPWSESWLERTEGADEPSGASTGGTESRPRNR